MISAKDLKLRRKLRETEKDLANLNRELAAQMIVLAGQTGDKQPLIDAVRNLATANDLYTAQDTPKAQAEIQKALGDTLLKLAITERDDNALEHAMIAFRGAITVASLLGVNDIRMAARKNYNIAMRVANENGIDVSMVGTA